MIQDDRTRDQVQVRSTRSSGRSEIQAWRDEQGQIMFSFSSRGNGDMVDGFKQENGMIQFCLKSVSPSMKDEGGKTEGSNTS